MIQQNLPDVISHQQMIQKLTNENKLIKELVDFKDQTFSLVFLIRTQVYSDLDFFYVQQHFLQNKIYLPTVLSCQFSCFSWFQNLMGFGIPMLYEIPVFIRGQFHHNEVLRDPHILRMPFTPFPTILEIKKMFLFMFQNIFTFRRIGNTSNREYESKKSLYNSICFSIIDRFAFANNFNQRIVYINSILGKYDDVASRYLQSVESKVDILIDEIKSICSQVGMDYSNKRIQITFFYDNFTGQDKGFFKELPARSANALQKQYCFDKSNYLVQQIWKHFGQEESFTRNLIQYLIQQQVIASSYFLELLSSRFSYKNNVNEQNEQIIQRLCILLKKNHNKEQQCKDCEAIDLNLGQTCTNCPICLIPMLNFDDYRYQLDLPVLFFQNNIITLPCQHDFHLDCLIEDLFLSHIFQEFNIKEGQLNNYLYKCSICRQQVDFNQITEKQSSFPFIILKDKEEEELSFKNGKTYEKLRLNEKGQYQISEEKQTPETQSLFVLQKEIEELQKIDKIDEKIAQNIKKSMKRIQKKLEDSGFLIKKQKKQE